MAAAGFPSRLIRGIVLALALLAFTGGCSGAPRPESPTAAPPTATIAPSAAVAPTTTPTETSSPTPTAGTRVAPTPTDAAPQALRSRIEIVWPHDGASVKEAAVANVTAYLMALDANEAPPCDWEPTVRLWAARNAEPARPIAVGEKRMETNGGRIFPVWDFNDIDVSAAQDPANKITFFATVDGVRTYHNVWVHAQDARTIVSQPERPAQLLENPPQQTDARIQIVWPHDDLPVDQADLANITVYLFETGTLNAVSAAGGWDPEVRLHRSLNAENEDPAADTPAGRARAIPLENGQAMLAWDFNDVDVSAARDRMNKLYFWVSVEDVSTFPNVWAHGADAPTVFPQLDVLESCR